MNIIKHILLYASVLLALTSNNIYGVQPLIVKKGDIITQVNKDKTWSVIKILEVDEWPDGTFTAHCLTYKTTENKPSKNDVESLETYIFHAPVDAASYFRGWELVANEEPKKKELVGFIEYLKLTDFQRYAKFTNQDIKALVSEANVNYKKAIAAGKKGSHTEAINLYSKAIELFPLFYEAIDNRAFTYMDMGDYEKAIEGFSDSLRVNPNGLSAFFSIGECLLKLGRYEEAMKVFEEGAIKFPEKSGLFREFYEKAKHLNKNG